MDYIIEFYKGLDSINLLIFWGVIIVITLLLIFSIIMINKNKELKHLIAEKKIGQSDDIPIKTTETKQTIMTKASNDIPVKVISKTTNEVPIKVIETVDKEASIPIEKTINIETNKVSEEVRPEVSIELQEHVIEKPVNNAVASESTEVKIESPKSFIAEEYIMNYHENNSSEIQPTSPMKTQEIKEPQMIVTEKPVIEKQTPAIPNQPYQRNVLREMSLNQTSPIGISRRNETQPMEHIKAEELNQSLNNDTVETKSSFNDMTKKADNNQQYLNEVSNKLNRAINGVERTEYEIKQEEDAIISYNELLKKRDSIKTIEEEEAVISIEELYRKEKNKLYGITEDEEDNTFIDELKNFRDDL